MRGGHKITPNPVLIRGFDPKQLDQNPAEVDVTDEPNYVLVFRAEERKTKTEKEPQCLVFYQLEEDKPGKVVKKILGAEVFVSYDSTTGNLIYLANDQTPTPHKQSVALPVANSLDKIIDTSKPKHRMTIGPD